MKFKLQFKKFPLAAIVFFIFFQSIFILLLVRHGESPLNHRYLAAASSLYSLFFWILLVEIFASIKRYKKTIQVLLALTISTVGLLSIANALYFGTFFDRSQLLFVIHDLPYLMSFAKTYVLNPIPVFGSLFVFLIFHFLLSSAGVLERSRKKVFFFLALNVISFFFSDRFSTTFISPDLSFLFSAEQAVASMLSRSNDIEILHARQLAHLKKPRKNSSKSLYNVILIENESMVADPGFEMMPKLKRWLEENAARTFYFDDLITNSTATDVSVPSILSGVSPEHSSDELHRAPLFWQWGLAHGLIPLFESSQQFNWESLNQFLEGISFYQKFSVETSGAPLINDLGIDDCLTEQAFEKTSVDLKDKPFIAFFQTNALHSPYQNKSSCLTQKENQDEAPFLVAHSILDEVYSRLFAHLKKTHLDQHTVVLFTSDHGERPEYPHHVPRIINFYDEIIRIPGFAVLPQSLILEHPEWVAALRANQHALVQNVDFAATIADLFGFEDDRISGSSLFRPIPSRRVLVTLNTNDIRKWAEEGFVVSMDQYRYVVNDSAKPQLFDVSRDPDQKHDLLLSGESTVPLPIEMKVRGNDHLRRILKKSLQQ